RRSFTDRDRAAGPRGGGHGARFQAAQATLGHLILRHIYGPSHAASRRCPMTRAASLSWGHRTIRYGAGIAVSCSAYHAGLLVLPTRRAVSASSGSSN